MFSKILIFTIFITYALGLPTEHAKSYVSVKHHDTPEHKVHVGHEHHHEDHHHEDDHKDTHHQPKYDFKYGVTDHHTGDKKDQQETRDGDVVKGSYTVAQPDGTVRKVEYSADHHTGFKADVSYSGKPKHH